MDEQGGNCLVLVRDLSSTRRVAQNSPTIVDWKETCTPSCLSCSSMLVPLPKARSVISKRDTHRQVPYGFDRIDLLNSLALPHTST